MALKLTDIEALLDKRDNSTHIYYNIPVETMKEFKRALGGDIETRLIFDQGSTYKVESYNVKVLLHTYNQ